MSKRSSPDKTYTSSAPRRHRPIALPDDRDEAPAGWTWRNLFDVARLESGHTPSRRRPEWWGGEIPWLALPDIRALDGQVVRGTLESINELGIDNSSARLLPAGTVALSRTASVGFVAVFGRPMATSQDFFNWVCGDELDPWFLVHALIASREYLRSLSSGAVHKTIYMPVAKALMICQPGIKTQRAIVKSITARNAELARLRAAIDQQLAELDLLAPKLLRVAFEPKGANT